MPGIFGDNYTPPPATSPNMAPGFGDIRTTGVTQQNPYTNPAFGPVRGIGGTLARGTAAPGGPMVFGTGTRQQLMSHPAMGPGGPGAMQASQFARAATPHGMIANGGVRPGVYNGPNSVQAAGGPYVPPSMQGRNPNDPRNAALAAYPGMSQGGNNAIGQQGYNTGSQGYNTGGNSPLNASPAQSAAAAANYQSMVDQMHKNLAPIPGSGATSRVGGT